MISAINNLSGINYYKYCINTSNYRKKLVILNESSDDEKEKLMKVRINILV
jgi:hypothetical protein